MEFEKISIVKYMVRVLRRIKDIQPTYNIDRIPYYALFECHDRNFGIEYAAEYLIQKYTKYFTRIEKSEYNKKRQTRIH